MLTEQGHEGKRACTAVVGKHHQAEDMTTTITQAPETPDPTARAIVHQAGGLPAHERYTYLVCEAMIKPMLWASDKGLRVCRWCGRLALPRATP